MLALAEANETTFAEFEALDRLEWAKTKIKLLKQLTTAIATDAESAPEAKQKAEHPAAQQEEQIVQAKSLAISSSPKETEIINFKSPKIDIKEILPENPKSDFLNIPSVLPKSAKQPQNSSLHFSDSLQAEHDSLTEELIQTVQLVRRNNIHLRDMVKADDQILEEATTLLTGNTDKIQREGRNLKEYSKTVWMTTWRMLSLMFFAVILFLFAYLFIRFT